MMLCLHLFNTLDYENLFIPLFFAFGKPLIYYISLFCDACVPIFAFVSGYGLYYKYSQSAVVYNAQNFTRLRVLYVNFWVIIFLFCVVGGRMCESPTIPGNLYELLLNASGLHTTYNGAWWFFTTYVFFVLTSSFWFKLLNKVNGYTFFIILLLVYLITFYLRVYKSDLGLDSLLAWAYRQCVLYFCTLLQFMLGAFALKYNWSIIFQRLFKKYLAGSTIAAFLMLLLLILIHAIIPNFVIAPFTGLLFIFIYLQFSIHKSLKISLDFFSKHSTNIWLIHMFFMSIYAREFVYSFQYPVLIFLVLIVLCLMSSYIINYCCHILNDKLFNAK